MFFVISDDEEWLEKSLQPRPNLAILKIPTPELAFAVLAQANVSIVTEGSFGLWGGILAGGRMLRLVPGYPPGEKEKYQGIEEDLPFVEYLTYV